MCNFKNCQGPHACFLRDISPCPASMGHEAEETGSEIRRATSRPRSKGFLDRDELIAALGVEDDQATPAPANDSDSNVVRISSKILLAAGALAHRKAS